MPREVWAKQFALLSCPVGPLEPKDLQELTGRRGFQAPRNIGVPIALRWLTVTEIGFPRRPFSVYRRPQKLIGLLEPLAAGPIDVNGHSQVRWGAGREMFYVTAQVAPAPRQRVVVDALDSEGEVIPGQRLVASTARELRFRCPGVTGLKLTGTGRVTAVQGCDQIRYANLPEYAFPRNQNGWELIARVGFPFESTAIPARDYDPSGQGPVGVTLSGRDAALHRLALARVLQAPMPATGLADFPAPGWPVPTPEATLNLLTQSRRSRSGETVLSPLDLVRKALTESRDLLFLPRQADIFYEQEVGGLRQADLGPPTGGGNPQLERSKVKLPIVATTMLQIASNGAVACGLGYGMTDLPPPYPPDEFLPEPFIQGSHGWDYMVTTKFDMPAGVSGEVAALAYDPGPLEPAAITGARREMLLRAPAADQPVNESVRLDWRVSTLPQTYAVCVRRSGGVTVLNARSAAGGYEPFVPQRPDSIAGDPEVDARTRFIDPVAPVPLAGEAVSKYGVVALDPFGRWSTWSFVDHRAKAPEVAAPGLHSVTFTKVDEHPTDRSAVRYRIDVDVSWDWTDRSPHRIELVGSFHAPDLGGAIPPVPTGLQLANGGPGGTPLILELTGDESDLPTLVAGGPTATVRIPVHRPDPDAPPARPHDPAAVQYRVSVTGVTVDFSAASKLAYSVFARGSERVRPSEMSQWAFGFRREARDTDGQLAPVPVPTTTVIADPVPPAQPSLTADLRWTALPDATGRARGRLDWEPVAGATGYVIWEATEAALRIALDPDAADPGPESPLRERADRLIEQMAQAARDPLRLRQANATFRRLNTRLVPGPPFEVELPGKADTLFAYRISAVSDAQTDSPRSDAAIFFAVPRRRQPGQPRLIVKSTGTPQTGLRLIAVAAPGVQPAGYRLYRVTRPELARELGTMGPPVIGEGPRWTATTVPSRLESGPVAGLEVIDDVPESWYPYHYRLVAVGAADRPNGYHSGLSVPSAVQEGARPPAALPVIEGISYEANATNAVLTFSADLPTLPTNLGNARIEIHGVELDDDRVTYAFDVDAIPEGAAFIVVPSPTAIDLEALPAIRRLASTGSDAPTYSLRVPAWKRGVVVARDPLGRARDLSFPLPVS